MGCLQDTLLEQADCSRVAADSCSGDSLVEAYCRGLAGSCSEDILPGTYSAVSAEVLILPCLLKSCLAEDSLEDSLAGWQVHLRSRICRVKGSQTSTSSWG